LEELSESKRRLFRKKRQQLMKKINLVRIKNGVYLLPFEKRKPSINEIRVFEQIEDLIRESHVKARYFVASQVKPQTQMTVGPLEELKKGIFSGGEIYFVLEPIKVLIE